MNANPMNPEPVNPEPGHPDASPARPTPPSRSRPRTSPIVWGVIFLAVCAWISQQVFFPAAVAAEVWIAGIILGVGFVLLAVAVTVVIRNANQSRHP